MKKGYKKDKSLRNVSQKLEKEPFINKHKEALKDFTRDRALTFVVIFMLILKKSIKSLQLALNELFMHKNINVIVSASAYTQARKKFKHTAFIELNDDTVNIYYEDDDIKRWKGYRCLGVDGSKIILPNTDEIKKEFGEIKITSQYVNGTYACALFECYYDVLNRIAVKSLLSPALSYEVDLAASMLKDFSEKDLLIYDRAYASYEFLAKLIKESKNYIIRCSKSSFKETQSLFEGKGDWSKVVTLTVPKNQKKNIESNGFPLQIKVRLVSVVLSTGEIEVLVTSLIDDSIQREEFKMLYGMRWGVEDFYNLIKGRLCLENFTGKSVESIKQDFWSTIFITNIETVLVEDIESEINAHLEAEQLNKKVNHAVSFNAIKNMAFEIFHNEKELAKTIEKLTWLFKTGTIVQRKDRSPPRKKKSDLRSYNFLRRIKKQVF